MFRLFGLVLLPFLTAQPCTTLENTEIGSGNIEGVKTTSAADCCTQCNLNEACIAWTWETTGSDTCYLKDNANGGSTNDGRTSGYRSAPLPIQNYTVFVDTKKIVNIVDDLYRSVTIDTTNNRQFFDVDWTEPLIKYLFASYGPMHVRIGGSGEGQDELLFDGTNCTKTEGCIDENLFDQIYDLVVTNGKSRMVWGLPYQKYSNNSWNPTASEGLISYAASKHYTIYGFELGNEDQSQVDDYPDIYAADFGHLNSILASYWPDVSTRPRLFGPDPQKDANWGLQQFIMQTKKQNVPMHGITSHEYYGMNNDAMIEGSRLDSNFHTSYNWTGEINYYYGNPPDRTMQMWAGEIGPSIGGSGNCTDYYHRFNIFADGFWYLDSLGAHAVAGYQVFCRQDFYGIDYALLDCVTHYPAPDYYLGILWNQVVSKYVFNTTRPTTKPDAQVRSYSHCSKQYDGGLVVMLINILNSTVNIAIDVSDGSLGDTREDYIMSVPGPPFADYPAGIYGKATTLNGVLINLTSSQQLPAFKPVQFAGANKTVIQMNGTTYGYFVFPKANIPLCKGTVGESTPVSTTTPSAMAVIVSAFTLGLFVFLLGSALYRSK